MKKKRLACVGKLIRERDQLGAYSLPAFVKKLESEGRESHKKHLKMSNISSLGLYKSLLPEPLLRLRNFIQFLAVLFHPLNFRIIRGSQGGECVLRVVGPCRLVRVYQRLRGQYRPDDGASTDLCNVATAVRRTSSS
jgi:hypothetical protein